MPPAKAPEKVGQVPGVQQAEAAAVTLAEALRQSVDLSELTSGLQETHLLSCHKLEVLCPHRAKRVATDPQAWRLRMMFSVPKYWESCDLKQRLAAGSWTKQCNTASQILMTVSWRLLAGWSPC